MNRNYDRSMSRDINWAKFETGLAVNPRYRRFHRSQKIELRGSEKEPSPAESEKGWGRGGGHFRWGTVWKLVETGWKRRGKMEISFASTQRTIR